LVAAFVACLIYVYISWLSPLYSYLGFPLGEDEHPALWFSIPAVLLTAAFMKTKITRFSEFFLWMVFFFAYTPSLLFIPLQGLLPDDGLALVCSLTLSFNIMRIIANCRMRLRVPSFEPIHLVASFFAVYAALNAWVLSVFGGHLNLADFANVYDQRFLAADVASGSLVGYATGMLGGAFNPLLMAIGLTNRRVSWFLLGATGQVFMYSTAALKSILLSAIIMPVFYYILLKRVDVTATRLGALVVASCLVPLAVIALLGSSGEGLPWIFVSLVFMRTYGLAGALTGIYADFFTSHPYTYYSHINIVSNFIPYPYDQSLGEEVGFFMVGSPLDANANFWASDGLAAAGNLGVVITGVLVGIFLMLMNSAITRRGTRLACVAFITFVMTVCNTSIFTALLSGGGALLLVMLVLWQSRLKHGPPSAPCTSHASPSGS
jgi:hypothetical protein